MIIVTPRVVMPLAARGTTTRSQDVTMSGSEREAVERLQALITNSHAPKYPKLVLDLMIKTREEVKNANQRIAKLTDRGTTPAKRRRFSIETKN